MRKQHWMFLLILCLAGPALAGDGTIHKPAGAELIKDRYIVVFNRDGRPDERASQLAAVHGGRVTDVFRYALEGAVYEMTEAQARALATNPNVAWVEQDAVFTINSPGSQSNPTWGLNRVDQRNLPLNTTYVWDFMGSGVKVFILDTGIRTSHTNFGGRASWGKVCTGEAQSDGHGHGTHVAGTVGSTTWGVAKGVSLVAVKVCTNSGSCPTSSITCGTDFVTQQKQASPSTPMVANMSLGGPASTTIDNAVNSSINAGVFYAVAAGNSNANACNTSPARVANAYTVGSTTSTDARSSFSNFGSCLDVFAPGSSITSTWNTSNTATNTISGTSMASPHAAGAAALVLEQFPTSTPAQVASTLNSRATTGKVTNPGSGSPNRLLYTRAQ